jgi:transcriptional regulator with XRE-family HTH domain
MNLRLLREQRLLSQERLAEMSGLSLRTIQRLEAGHRVSYASLRALAATLEIDVDLLERELYAMNRSTDDFVEIPTWWRLLDGARWFGGPRLSRRDVHLIETFCVACAVIVFAGSFLVASDVTAKVLRAFGFLELVCGYLVSVFIRLGHRYKHWPSAGCAPSDPQQLRRTWRSITGEYAFLFGVGILGTVIICWLAF